MAKAREASTTAGVSRRFRRFRFSRPFWEASIEKVLKLQFCPESETFQFFPRPASLKTGKRNLIWKESPGLGEIYTYTIVRRAFGEFRGTEPYVIATVLLDEGVDVIAELVNCDLKDVAIGMRVEPYWMPLPEGEHLLMFQPIKAARLLP